MLKRDVIKSRDNILI